MLSSPVYFISLLQQLTRRSQISTQNKYILFSDLKTKVSVPRIPSRKVGLKGGSDVSEKRDQAARGSVAAQTSPGGNPLGDALPLLWAEYEPDGA
jgi:hypothetical protein